MYIVLLSYIKPLEEIEALLSVHVQFLDEQYKQKKFIFSGPRNPRIGGVIVANIQSKDELNAILQKDPFHMQKAADYEIIEFTPTKYDPRLSVIMTETHS
ncbi:YciI family protein [Paenibacillus sp. sptzw28]|uniref:YciI family protein n=1 Tax=Paenibacillus sp. sptzw28 TaxID=715179 RepID=UPI001C6E6788|nr:YciI family protein [Paenibacillus sp. sptzw28]QYR19508.1 YciI family protein [Paenibacillus sp. sptzw28]